MNFDELARQFNDKQLEQIQLGIEEGLTNEEIALYADPKFDHWQMYEIQRGLAGGILSTEQVALYADPKFNDQQMWQIRKGLEWGFGRECRLTTEQVKFYANPKFNATQMNEIVEGFIKGLPQDKVAQYANPQYTWEQMREMRTKMLLQKQSPPTQNPPKKKNRDMER